MMEEVVVMMVMLVLKMVGVLAPDPSSHYPGFTSVHIVPTPRQTLATSRDIPIRTLGKSRSRVLTALTAVLTRQTCKPTLGLTQERSPTVVRTVHTGPHSEPLSLHTCGLITKLGPFLAVQGDECISDEFSHTIANFW